MILALFSAAGLSGQEPEVPLPVIDDTDVLELSLEELASTPVEALVDTEITAASRTPERGSDAPATVYLITKDDIRNRGYSTLRDVLRDVPGMEVIDNYFSEIGTLVPVRGVVGNNKIIVLVNGMRVNPPGGEEMMLRSDFSIRMAERIEIVYGPGSMIWGQDAVNAIINVITTEGDFGEALCNFGRNDFKEGFVGISRTLGSGPNGPIRFSAFFHGTNSDLTDLSREYPAWWAGYNAAAHGAPNSSRRWDQGYNAFMRIEDDSSSIQAWFRDSSRSSAEGAYRPILYYVDEAIWHDQSILIEAKNRHEFSENAALTSRLVYDRYEIDPETRYVWPSAPNVLFYDDYKYGIGSSVRLEELLSLKFTERFEATIGFEAAFYDIIPKATVPGGAETSGNIVEQAGNFTYYTVAGDPTSAVDVPRATNLKYSNVGYFVQGRLALLDSLDLVGGVRIDHNTRYKEVPVSPRAALIYRNSAHNYSVKYIYSQAFVGPPPYFAYNVFDNGTALNTSNPDLEPETADSHEVNVTWHGEQTLLGMSAYFNSQTNLFLAGDLLLPVNILQDPVYMDAAGTQSRVLTQSANGGNNSVVGLDLYGRYEADRLSLWTSYSYVDVQNVVNGVQTSLPQISRHNVRFGFTWDIWENLKVTPSVIYRSTPDDLVTTDLADQIRNPTEFNLYLLYTPFDNFDLFAEYRNIGDREYALKGVLGPMPQETFRATAGARWRF